MHWFKHLDPAAQAAVIAGVVAVVTALVTAVSTTTNIMLKARLDRRSAESAARDLQRDLYRKYADPLTSAAESLYWRFREIFELGRSGYLGPGGGLTRFEKYKESSTLYRIAALLGWITALKRELALSNAQSDRSVGPMRDAVHTVGAALAEGGHIERVKATGLAELWRVDGLVIERAGQDIDVVVDRCRHDNEVASVAELGEQQQLAMLADVAKALVSTIDRDDIPAETIRQTRNEAIALLSTKEAWIYRDYQDAVGDWMLRENTAGARRFDVMSYREFSSRERAPTNDDTVWMELLRGLTDDLDLTGKEKEDARIAQLRAVHQAVGNLIVQFHDAEPKLSSIGEATLAAVPETLSVAPDPS